MQFFTDKKNQVTLYQMYDLGLDSGEDVLSAETCDNADLNTYDDSETVENSGDDNSEDDGVKVLNYNTEEEEININEIIKLPSLLNVKF